MEGGGFDNDEGGVEGGMFPADTLGFEADKSELARRARVAEHYARGVRRYLALGKKVILVYPIPEAGWHVPVLLAKLAIRDAAQDELTTSYDRFRSRNAATLAAFDSISDANLYRVKPHEILCDTYVKNRCANSANGTVLYLDTNHVSNAGARLIAAAVADIARRITQGP